MADRTQFSRRAQRFFEAFDAWQPAGAFADIFRGALPEGELARKAVRYRKLVDRLAANVRGKLKLQGDWDRHGGAVTARIAGPAMYHLFTGDGRYMRKAVEALDPLERCPQPYFCQSVCVGASDVDLQTASVIRALARMKSAFGEALDARSQRRLRTAAVERCLRPGLEGQIKRTFRWSKLKTNWRSVAAGSLGIGAMAFADEFEDYRELIEYGMEGVLIILEEADRDGGWNEGPGYWEYGIGHAAEFAWYLRAFTGGAVDLFRHPYLKRAGDFRIYMTTTPGQAWNWSDGHKAVASSTNLALLGRVFQNPVYQWSVHREGVRGLGQVYYLDPDLKPQEPVDWAKSKTFRDLGVTVMRTGFRPKDAFVGVKAGAVGHGIGHVHLDLGSVTIFAEGRELLAEMPHWTYAEGRGKAGGFFDRTLQRWSYDSNAAIGHNLVTVEGRYPKFLYKGKARITRTDIGGDRELVTVDPTLFYKPLCRRVRRYLVYHRPDLVVLIDELRAREPIRARSQFHYLSKAETRASSFVLKNGRAALEGVSVHPSVDDNVIIGHEDRLTNYHTTWGQAGQRNRYVYVENVQRTDRVVFVTVLQFGAAPLPTMTCKLSGDPLVDDAFTVTVRRGRTSQQIRIDLNTKQVT